MADHRVSWVSMAHCLKVCFVFIVMISHGYCTVDLPCIEVKKAYTEKGFDENEVPMTAKSGADLSICPDGETCCTRSMEENLKSLSRKEHDKRMDESFKLLKTTFYSGTRKFDGFFTNLIDTAASDLHEMYIETYGLIYQQNAEIFTTLFDDLRGYYKGKNKNLMEVMDAFFSKLLQKMFELLNSDYIFNDHYMACVTEHMNKIKPFGDVPTKLSLHVKRAFIAARTFVQGLAVGSDVVANIMDIAPTDPCIKAVVKMSYCPHCRGLTSTKPCFNYCLNTMKGCLAHQADLNPVWNEYIDAMNMLATKLEGPFNIEAVVNPINVKISNAIMNLQENNQKVSPQIFEKCGAPQLMRAKRDAAAKTAPQMPQSSEHKHRPASSSSSSPASSYNPHSSSSQQFTFEFDRSFNGKSKKSNKGWHSGSNMRTSLDRLVRDIKEKVKVTKDFWVQLPYTLCNDEELAATVDDNNGNDCWNGKDRAKYIPSVLKDGVLQQIYNPEVEVDVTKTNSVVNRQKVQLQLIVSKLNNAYKGEDVDWIDTEIETDFSGSGSGGSGDDIFVDQGSGSGDFRKTNSGKPTVTIDNTNTNIGGHGQGTGGRGQPYIPPGINTGGRPTQIDIGGGGRDPGTGNTNVNIGGGRRPGYVKPGSNNNFNNNKNNGKDKNDNNNNKKNNNNNNNFDNNSGRPNEGIKKMPNQGVNNNDNTNNDNGSAVSVLSSVTLLFISVLISLASIRGNFALGLTRQL